MNRFPDLSVTGLANAVAAYRDSAAEARRLAALKVGTEAISNSIAVLSMRATLEQFAVLMELKATNLEAKIAETATTEGCA